MKIETKVGAAGVTVTDNQSKDSGLKVESDNVNTNHNQAVGGGLKTHSRIKAGRIISNHNQSRAH